MSAQVAVCAKCQQPKLVTPLHGEKGGPLLCIPCGVDWHSRSARVRRLRHTAIRAMRAYGKASDKKFCDFERLKFAAWGMPLYADDKVNGTQPGELTLELLNDAVRLTHPDRHPDRAELATRVTQALLALKPYVYPEEKPEPPKPRDRNASVASQRGDTKEAFRSYPCELCADEYESNYCAACKAKAEEARKLRSESYEAKKTRQRERRRKRYREKKFERTFWERHKNEGPKCATCEKPFEPKRKDAKHCSSACRQRAHRRRGHRQRVTASSLCTRETPPARNEASA